jgi:hypothetical protein
MVTISSDDTGLTAQGQATPEVVEWLSQEQADQAEAALRILHQWNTEHAGPALAQFEQQQDLRSHP